MERIVIRLAHQRDVPEWADLRQLLWPDDLVQHIREATQLLELPHKWAIWVAETSPGTLVGFLEASLREYADGCETSPVGYLEGIYVKPEYRQQGISRRLVQVMENWAKAQGCTEAASDAELENLVSQQMHRQLGFDEVERIVIFRKALQ